jgi:hypothetical protein
MPPPAPSLPRRSPATAAWSAPARLRSPSARPSRRLPPRRESAATRGKLLIVTANFALFLLYVVTLVVLGSEPGSGLRIVLPALLGALGFACFAPLALALTRKPRRRRRHG